MKESNATARSATHATFVIERHYPFPPSKVFGAWAKPTSKARWFSGSAEWPTRDYTLDFRVGGRERVSTGPFEAPHIYDAEYRDIVPAERIIYCYDMFIGEKRISVSLATVQFFPDASATRMLFTEQVVFLDGYDDAGSRERGTHWLLDKLGASLEAA
jgi:uncharacterized protein YndB with AHSA1/START domain